MQKIASGEATRKRFVSRREDPPVAKSLFSDTRWAWIWLILRLYVGWEWLSGGWGKLNNPAWTGDQAGTPLTGFVNGALRFTSMCFRRLRWGIGMALLLLAACSNLGKSQPAGVMVEVNDAGYQPTTIEMAAGEAALLTLKNTGSAEHQLGIAKIPLTTQGGGMAEHNMAGMDGTMAPGTEQLQVHLVAAPSATTSLELTPAKAGDYTFRCIAPGHTEQGMLVVKR